MKIRKQQMERFDSVVKSGYHQRLAVFIRKELPEKTMELSEEELLEIIRRGEKRAEAYNVKTERAVAKWVILALISTEEFDTDAQVREYLLASTPSHSRKMDNLLEAVRDKAAEMEGAS